MSVAGSKCIILHTGWWISVVSWNIFWLSVLKWTKSESKLATGGHNSWVFFLPAHQRICDFCLFSFVSLPTIMFVLVFSCNSCEKLQQFLIYVMNLWAQQFAVVINPPLCVSLCRWLGGVSHWGQVLPLSHTCSCQWRFSHGDLLDQPSACSLLAEECLAQCSR